MTFDLFPRRPIKENFLTGFVDVEKLFDGTVWPTIAQSHPSVVKLAVELALSALPEAEQWRVIAARIYCEVGTACFFEVTQSSADAFLEAALGTAMLNVLSQDMKKRLLTALHNDHPTLGVSVANSAAGTKTSSAAMMRTRFGRLLTALKQIKADKTVTDVIRRITDLAVEATVSGNIESASGWISLCATDLIYHNTDRMDDAIYKNLVDIVVHDVDAVKSVFAAVEPLVEAALGGKPSKTTSTPSIHVCSSLWQTLDAQNGMPSTDAAIIVINAYTTLVTLDCKLLTQYIKRAAAQNKNVADEALLTTVQRLLFIFNQLSTFIKNLGKIDLNADVSHFFRRILHSTSPGDTTSVITRTAIPGLYAMLVSSLTEYRKSAMVFFARSGQDRIATAADVYAMTLRDYTAESLRAYFALVALVTPKMLATDWGMKLGCRVAFMGADCAVFLFGADERHTSNAVLKKMGDVERNATLHRFFHTTWKLFMLVTPLAARSEGVDSKMAEGLSVALARILETSKVLVGVYTSSSELLSLLTLRENVDNKSVLFPQPATWFDTLLKALQQVRHRPAIVDLFCTCLNATTKCGVKLGEEELTELSSLVNGSTLDSELKKTLVAGIITTNNMALMNCIGANDAGSSGATGMAEQALTDEQLAELIWGDTEMQEMNETEEVTPTMEDMNITSPQSPDQLLPQTPVEEEPIVAKEEPTAASVVASAVSVDAESSDSLNRLRELLLRKKNAMGSDVAENAKPTKMAKVRAHDSSSESENEQKQDTTTAGFSKLLDDCSPKKVQPVAIPADDGASRKMSVSSISREMDALHAEILNWDYWRMSDEEHRLCALRKQLPRTFSTSDEYREGMAVREENDLHLLHTVEPVTAFKPLIIAECHAELMRNFEEMSQGTAKLLSMMVTNAQPGASFVHVQMNVDTSQSAFATLSENDILVMTPESPSSTDVNRCFELPRGMSKSSSKDTRSAKPFVAFALVKSIAMRYSSVASVQIRIHLNRGKMFRTRSNWTGLRVGSAATINREYRAMATVEELKAPLRNEILNNTTMRRQLAQIDDVTVASIMSAYRLNRSQAVAVGRATRTSDGFVLIQGPPGTGKTKTILGCIGALLSAEGTLIAMPGAKQPPRYRERVLVCAPSNAAVDELVRRVRRGIYDSSGVLFYPKVVRLGTIDAASDSVRELTLDQLVDTAIIDDADLSFSMREAASSKIVTVQQELVALKSLLESKYAELLSTDDEAPVENEIRMLALQRQRLMDQFIREAQTHEKTRRHFDRAKTGLRSKILVGRSSVCNAARTLLSLQFGFYGHFRTRRISCCVRYR